MHLHREKPEHIDISPLSLRRELQEKCGVVGVVIGTHSNLAVPSTIVASRLVQLGLEALIHRGFQSSGIATSNPAESHIRHMVGLRSFAQRASIDDLYSMGGRIAVGHTRYSTHGDVTSLRNAQPLLGSVVLKGKEVQCSISHNGNLTNTHELLKAFGMEHLEDSREYSDSSMIVRLVSELSRRKSYNSELDLVEDVVRKLEGAFSVLFQFPECLIAVRDPWGNRPLSIAKMDDSYLVASETCAFEAMEGKILNVESIRVLRDVAPGEIIRFAPGREPESRGIKTTVSDARFCSLELAYLMRESSMLAGREVRAWRYDFGYRLGQEILGGSGPLKEVYGNDEYVVVGVPSTGIPGAQGLADALGLECVELFKLNPQFVHARSGMVRTFIQDNREAQQLAAMEKLVIDPPALSRVRGKRVVKFDDSMVRGTMEGRALRHLENSGIAELHLALGYPKVRHPCFFGISIPDRDRLIAHQYPSDASLADHFKVKSVTFLSEDGLAAIGVEHGVGLCTGCTNLNYGMPIPSEAKPVELTLEMHKEA